MNVVRRKVTKGTQVNSNQNTRATPGDLMGEDRGLVPKEARGGCQKRRIRTNGVRPGKIARGQGRMEAMGKKIGAGDPV